MRLKNKAFFASALTLTFMGIGSMSAQAAYKYITLGSYQQEQDNWCWAATSKSLITYHTANNPSQCTIVKWAKGTSACGDVTGSFGSDVSAALFDGGISHVGSVSTGAYSYANTQAQINVNRPSWSAGGGTVQAG